MRSARTSSPWLLALVGALALALSACGKDGGDEKDTDPKEPAAATPTGEPAKPAEPEPAKAGAGAELDAVLDRYEQIRAQLAKDDVKGAVAPAAELQAAADSAARGAAAELKPHLEQVASAAAAMGKASAEDAGAVRKAFGEVSRPMVEALAAAPEAREGWHVFECPMAQGYKKWVQPTAELSNPYMGTEMLTCGSEADWTAGG